MVKTTNQVVFFVFFKHVAVFVETVAIICHSRDLPRPILRSLFDDKVRYQDKLNLHFPYLPDSSMLVAWKTNLPRKVGHVLVTLWPPHLFLVPAKIIHWFMRLQLVIACALSQNLADPNCHSEANQTSYSCFFFGTQEKWNPWSQIWPWGLHPNENR
jgi:hypothetical protein